MRLCRMALSHARFLADYQIFEHSPQEVRRHCEGFCGENLAETVIWHEDYRRPFGEEVTLNWYDEGQDYNFSKIRFDPDAAQFTQLIWKATKYMGIAYAEYEPQDSPGYVKTVIVANYFPCGNVQSKFEDNVEMSRKTYGGELSKVRKKISQYQRKKEIIAGANKDYQAGNLG